MNHSGEAAEQVFRMTLDGAEVAIRLAGAGAKNLAVLLYTILSQQKKTKGRARLETMLRSGKELDVFNVKNSDMQMFVEKAKQYGILYCVMRDPKGSPDGITPVMVRVEDARRINDIVERFNFAVVNTATVRADIEKSRAEKAPAEPEKAVPEKAVPDRDATDKVVDELFEKPLQKEQAQPENPTAAKMEKSLPSEPISEKPRRSAEGTTKPPERASSGRTSVREELKQIKAAKQQEAESPRREEPQRESKAKQNKPAQHKQPQQRPRKQKKSKER